MWCMSEITLGHAPFCILSMRKQTKEGHGKSTADTKLSLRSVVFKSLFLPLVNNHFLFGAINASCLRSIWAISPVPPGELQDTLSHQASCQHETGDASPQSMPGHQIMSPNFFSPNALMFLSGLEWGTPISCFVFRNQGSGKQ